MDERGGKLLNCNVYVLSLSLLYAFFVVCIVCMGGLLCRIKSILTEIRNFYKIPYIFLTEIMIKIILKDPSNFIFSKLNLKTFEIQV